ncbi:MAG: DUF6785 family protein [Candidatus Latescibacterota bacterium]|nr:DUF6785 family protein [Candidatus Latescibacterota bacterium]
MSYKQAPSEAPSALTEESRGTVTWRSLIAGVVVALCVIVWNTYVEYIEHGARLNITHFPLSLFVALSMLGLANGWMRIRNVFCAFDPTEFMVVVGLGLIGAAVPAYGLTSYFLGVIAIPYYLATPENQWAMYFHQYLPTWLIPSNEGDAMRWLFEGFPRPGMSIPWGVWLGPMLGWMAFIGAIVLACICLAVMHRKQWAEHERLPYPILHPARALAEVGDGEAESHFRNQYFWIGVSVPFFILTWNIIEYFVPGFPLIDLHHGWLSMGGGLFPSVHVGVNWYTIGFAYFANIDVLFSIVMFYIYYYFQIAAYRRLGIALSKKGARSDGTVALQAMGAFIALVLTGLWFARHHLKDIFRKAIDTSYPVDDRDELLSYRSCVFGFLFGFLFIVCWLNAIGIAIWAAVIFTIGMFMAYLGIARVISETGVVYYSWNMGPEGFLNLASGNPNIFDPSTKTALRIVAAIKCQNKGMFMVPIAQAVRIGGAIAEHKRRLILGVGVTVVLGIVVSIVYSLNLGYTYGAYNFNDYPFTRYPPNLFNGLVNALKSDVKWELSRYAFVGGGALMYVLVGSMRYRFAWWPLAPVGLVVPLTHGIASIFSLFLTWAAKSIILQIGGVALYRRLRPTFVGLLVGHALGVLLSFIVDMIWFPGFGHHTHSW